MSNLFRKKPVIIESFQYTGVNTELIINWCGGDAEYLTETGELIIFTLEDGKKKTAKHIASVNDWIIKGIKGEFYPCKPDIFKMTYEPVLINADL